MRMIITLSLVVLACNSALAAKNCTSEPKENWMTEEAFRTKVEAEGYTIKKFKQPGTCYEIYGTNKDGKKVEIYFNPVDGTPKKKSK